MCEPFLSWVSPYLVSLFDQTSKGICDADEAACGTPCDPGGVRKEGGTGENDRVLYDDEKRRKHTACVSDSNDEKEKDPEVQVKSLARGPAFVGYPEHEEPKQSRRVEGNCETSLYSKRSILVSNWREEL